MSLEGQEAACVTPAMEASVKPEPLWDSDDADCELNNEQEFGSVVLKEELELGPVVLQPPDAVYALRALEKKERPACGPQAVPRRTCSVVLEPMLVDMELCVCKIARQVYEFRSWPENDTSHSEEESNSRKEFGTAVALRTEEEAPRAGRTRSVVLERLADTESRTHPTESKSSRAGLLAAKKTESPETNKRLAPVEEKKQKPSKKIAKIGCDECDKGFDIKCNLEKHINTHMLMKASTTQVDKIFTCKACNCTFNTKLFIQEHEKTRHGVRYFACDKCEFTVKYALRHRHLKSHTDEKPFTCAQNSPLLRFLRQYNKQFSSIDLFDCTKSNLKNRIRSLMLSLDDI